MSDRNTLCRPRKPRFQVHVHSTTFTMKSYLRYAIKFRLLYTYTSPIVYSFITGNVVERGLEVDEPVTSLWARSAFETPLAKAGQPPRNITVTRHQLPVATSWIGRRQDSCYDPETYLCDSMLILLIYPSHTPD